MSVPVKDPWAVEARGEGPARLLPVALAVAAWALGVAGPAVAVWGNGENGQRGAFAVAVGGALVEAGLRLRRSVAGPALGLAGVACGFLASTSVVGRAPFLVAIVGIVLADLILFVPRLPGRFLDRQAPVATLALPPFLAGTAGWAHGQAPIPLALGWGVALGVLVVHQLAPAPLARIDGSVARFTLRLGHLVGDLVLLLVALPLLYLPGLVARLVRTLVERFRPPSSAWRVRRVSPATIRRDARYPFASVDRRTRRLRHAGSFLVVVLSVAVAVVVVRSDSPERVRERPSTRPGAVDRGGRDAPLSATPAFADVPFADELAQEQLRLSLDQLESDPDTGFRVGEFDGTFTHVHDGVRTTTPPGDCDGCRELTVWFMGGSAAFGVGQRDAGTISSALVAEGERHGYRLDVVNLATPGWTITQESARILQRIETAAPRPDLVVFYDGFNDIAGRLFRTATRGAAPPGTPNLLEGPDIVALVGKPAPTFGTPAEVLETGRQAAAEYETVRARTVQALDAKGVASAFFFQADAFGSARQREGLEATYRATPQLSRLWLEGAPALATAAEQLSPTVTNLRGVLDDHPRSVFADTVHTNEEGARVVAGVLFDDLESELRRLSS